MENSDISWTDHTFNPWWGCVKVSEACANCYAETLANRFHGGLWGAGAQRRKFSEKHWNEPYKWDRRAEKEGVQRRVFCASMADVFEDRIDLNSERERLWETIWNTQNLTWMLLTKRPDKVLRLIPARWAEEFPHNVWIGTTAETQERYDERIIPLLQIPAPVRFISAEPLLGPLEMTTWDNEVHDQPTFPEWVIVGGESGPKARTMSLWWLWAIVQECKDNAIPIHIKQLSQADWKHFRDFKTWPTAFQLRQFPSHRNTNAHEGGA